MSNEDIKTIIYNIFREWLISFISYIYLIDKEFTYLQLFNLLKRVVKVTTSLKTPFASTKDSVKDFFLTLKVETESPPPLIKTKKPYLTTLMIEKKVDALTKSFK